MDEGADAGGAQTGDPLWDDWDLPPRAPPTTTIVHLDGYDGPMVLLLDLAERQRIDLGRISIGQLAEQFAACMDRLVAVVPMNRRAGWLVLAARLVQLRSQSLLTDSPEDNAAAQQAATAAEGTLLERLRLRAATDWLDHRVQLGRDVFARPVPARQWDGGLLDLLEGVLPVMDGPRRPPALPESGLPALFRGWPVAEARARILSLLPGPSEPPLPLLTCLPEDDSAQDAGSPPPPLERPEAVTHCWRRIRISSLFSAALELAKEGVVDVEEHDNGLLLCETRQDTAAA